MAIRDYNGPPYTQVAVDKAVQRGRREMQHEMQYELTEARSEISRHHTLITDLRDGLDWALSFIAAAEIPLNLDDHDKYDGYRRLLNRQVG